jgi:SAM-dependent methyltransferase
VSRRGLFSLGAARLVPGERDLAALGAAWRNYHAADAGVRRPDFAVLRREAVEAWGTGDPRDSARFLAPAAAALVEAAGVRPGDRVLDAGAGDGNLALAAADAGAHVTAVDLSPRQVEAGRARCAGAEWLVADIEALPFDDGAFDHALSSFGAMFTPRPQVAARELARVTRPGGCVGMATWSSTGFMSRVLDLPLTLKPLPPGVSRPARWGRYESAFLWMDGQVDGFAMERGSLRMELESADAAWTLCATAPGPLSAALRQSPEPARDRVRAAFMDLLETFDRSESPPAVAVDASYALVTGRAPARAPRSSPG